MQEIDNLVKFKEAEKFFTGSILDKKIEAQYNINHWEGVGYSILQNFIPSNKKDSKFFQYFALHNVRNITNFLFLRNYLYNQIIIKDKIKSKNIFSTFNYGSLICSNKKILNQIDNEINLLNKSSISDFENFARLVFNLTYPIIWGNKTNFYSYNRYWYCCELTETESFSFGTNLVLDFSDPLYKNIEEFNMFKNLPLEYQEIIKNSVIIVQGKNIASIGVILNNKTKNIITKLEKTIINNQSIENLKFWVTIKEFMFLFSLTTSYKEIIITSEKHRENVVNTLFFNYESLKEENRANEDTFTMNGKFKY